VFAAVERRKLARACKLLHEELCTRRNTGCAQEFSDYCISTHCMFTMIILPTWRRGRTLSSTSLQCTPFVADMSTARCPLACMLQWAVCTLFEHTAGRVALCGPIRQSAVPGNPCGNSLKTAIAACTVRSHNTVQPHESSSVIIILFAFSPEENSDVYTLRTTRFDKARRKHSHDPPVSYRLRFGSIRRRPRLFDEMCCLRH